jgi:hypothetical protein
VQPDHAALEEVVEAPRGRDDELDAEAEVAELRALGGAAWGGGGGGGVFDDFRGERGMEGRSKKAEKSEFFVFRFLFRRLSSEVESGKKNSRRLLSIDAP